MMSLNWDDIKFFLAIARLKTLSATAESMGIGVATVSRKLERIEKDLGIKLFSHHQTGYLLTDDGEVMLAKAELIESAINIFSEQSQIQENVAGLVRIATTENLATEFIIPNLSALLNKYQNLNIELVGGIKALNIHQRDADLAIRTIRPTTGNLTIKKLGVIGLGIYCSNEFLLTINQTTKLNLPYIGWSESFQNLAVSKWIDRNLKGTCRLEVNSLVMQLSAIANGIGIGILPHFMAKRDNRLHCIYEDPELNQDLWMVVHTNLMKSSRVKTVCDYLVSLFAENKSLLELS